MQKEITKEQNLLNDHGHINETGWARDLVLKYNRENINAPLKEIKEWDYYYTGNDEYGFGVSMANMGEVRALSVHFMDYVNEKYYMNFASTPLLNKASHQMPLDSQGNVEFGNENATCRYNRTKGQHDIEITFKDYYEDSDLEVSLSLAIPDTESMVIVVPFDESPNLFYYNQKINCLHPNGTVKFGEKVYDFSSGESFSVLDWGRGVWPSSSTWYWGSASGQVNGVDFGFNIGYGFGNPTASENLLFYNGKVHKLEEIQFHFPENSFIDPWKFTSSDGRFEMDFQPILDRHSDTSRGKFSSNQHQVFGEFNGKAILDDGTEINVTNFMGFAEEVSNAVNE